MSDISAKNQISVDDEQAAWVSEGAMKKETTVATGQSTASDIQAHFDAAIERERRALARELKHWKVTGNRMVPLTNSEFRSFIARSCGVREGDHRRAHPCCVRTKGDRGHSKPKREWHGEIYPPIRRQPFREARAQ